MAYLLTFPVRLHNDFVCIDSNQYRRINLEMKSFTAILSFCLLLNSSLGFWLSQNSCQNACTNEYKPEQSCQCNPECLSHNNCCSDYDSACQSCQDRCGNGLQNEFPCQCNDKCTDFKDCCADYDTICIGDHGGKRASNNLSIILIVHLICFLQMT